MVREKRTSGGLRGADSQPGIRNFQLSEEEEKVMLCYSYGMSREEIAKELGMTLTEVEILTASTYRRLHQLVKLMETKCSSFLMDCLNDTCPR
jgi:DNA-binding CsgD family transcriptional regulator